jgi:hypothetical protein
MQRRQRVGCLLFEGDNIMLIVSREASQNARVTPIGCWAILSAPHDIFGHFNGGGCLMKLPDASISVPPLKGRQMPRNLAL